MTDKLDLVRPMFELRGRNYLVTGGAQGIGFAATRAICEMGGNVAVLDIQERPTTEFEELALKFDVKTSYHRTDLTKQDSLKAGFEKALEALGYSIDGCVPAAGIAIDKPFVDQTRDEFTRIQEINVRGVFFITQLVTKQIIKQGTPGSIVLIASQSSHIGLPGYRMAAYNASKGDILMLSKALAVELAKHNIRVNTISPADAMICSTGWKKESTIKFAGLDRTGLGLPIDAKEQAMLSLEYDSKVLAQFPILEHQPALRSNPKKSAEPLRYYRFMVPSAMIEKRNFAFAGMIPSVSTAICASTQGLWITAFFDGKLEREAKSQEEITREIMMHTQWGKWRYPCGYGASLPDFVFEGIPYVDMLLKDVGIKNKRKPNFLQELISPYTPKD